MQKVHGPSLFISAAYSLRHDCWFLFFFGERFVYVDKAVGVHVRGRYWESFLVVLGYPEVLRRRRKMLRGDGCNCAGGEGREHAEAEEGKGGRLRHTPPSQTTQLPIHPPTDNASAAHALYALCACAVQQRPSARLLCHAAAAGDAAAAVTAVVHYFLIALIPALASPSQGPRTHAAQTHRTRAHSISRRKKICQ